VRPETRSVNPSRIDDPHADGRFSTAAGSRSSDVYAYSSPPASGVAAADRASHGAPHNVFGLQGVRGVELAGLRTGDLLVR
jgi:hypothetical protein